MTVDILIPSRDRPELLKNCLLSVKKYSDPSNVNIFLLDNSQILTNNSIYKKLAFENKINYLKKKEPGLSKTLNYGIKNSKAEIIVFLDDDTEAQPSWLENLLRSFKDNEVSYVSGQMVPAKTEKKAEKLFEMKKGLSKGFKEITYFNKDFFKKFGLRFTPVFFFALGGNSAIRRSVIDKIGLFDEDFGCGSKIGAGNMGELGYRIIKYKFLPVHNPNAVVKHYHREDLDALFNLRYRYGKADTAIMAKALLYSFDIRGLITAFFYHPWKRLFQGFLLKKYPKKLVLVEFLGNWVGIFQYFLIYVDNKVKSKNIPC